jgi:hypothetical protein
MRGVIRESVRAKSRLVATTYKLVLRFADGALPLRHPRRVPHAHCNCNKHCDRALGCTCGHTVPPRSQRAGVNGPRATSSGPRRLAARLPGAWPHACPCPCWNAQGTVCYVPVFPYAPPARHTTQHARAVCASVAVAGRREGRNCWMCMSVPPCGVVAMHARRSAIMARPSVACACARVCARPRVCACAHGCVRVRVRVHHLWRVCACAAHGCVRAWVRVRVCVCVCVCVHADYELRVRLRELPSGLLVRAAVWLLLLPSRYRPGVPAKLTKIKNPSLVGLTLPGGTLPGGTQQ